MSSSESNIHCCLTLLSEFAFKSYLPSIFFFLFLNDTANIRKKSMKSSEAPLIGLLP